MRSRSESSDRQGCVSSAKRRFLGRTGRVHPSPSARNRKPIFARRNAKPNRFRGRMENRSAYLGFRDGRTKPRMKLVVTLTLILTFSPGEKEQPLSASDFANDFPASPVAGSSVRRRVILLLLGEKAGMREVVKTLQHQRAKQARQGWHICSPTISRRTKPRLGRHILLCRSYGACKVLWAGFYKYAAPLALGKVAVNTPAFQTLREGLGGTRSRRRLEYA